MGICKRVDWAMLPVIEQYINWFDVFVEVATSFIVESVARTSQSAKSGPWLC